MEKKRIPSAGLQESSITGQKKGAAQADNAARTSEACCPELLNYYELLGIQIISLRITLKSYNVTMILIGNQ